jgi:hypothetical protein
MESNSPEQTAPVEEGTCSAGAPTGPAGQLTLQSAVADATGAAPTPIASLAVIVSDTRSNRARRWSKLESIAISNFKAIKETTIPFVLSEETGHS